METTDLRSEAILLGSAMRSTDTLNTLMDLGDITLFQKPSHKSIFRALESIYAENTSPTPNAVQSMTKRLGDPVPLTHILSFSYELSGDEDPRFFIERLRHLKHNDLYINAIRHAAQNLNSANDAHEEIAALTQSFELIESNKNQAPKNLQEIFEKDFRDSGRSLQEYIDHKMSLHAQGIHELSGISTGFKNLDEMTDGLQKAWLYVFGARPSEGKSQFLINLIHNVSMASVPSLFFSLEMPASEVALELATIHSKTCHKQISEGTIDPYHYANFINGLTECDQFPLIIDDQPSLNTNQIRARIKRAIKTHGIQAVFIDYLQEVKSPNKHPNQQEAMQFVSRSLREMAKEFKIPIICAAQVNRESEKTEESKPPLASHLRESGQIEQCAWFIGMLHRPDKIDPYSRPGLLDVYIRKNRFGKTGRLTFNHSPDTGYSYRLQEYDPL